MTITMNLNAMVRGGIALILFLAASSPPSSLTAACVAARDDGNDVCRGGAASGETTGTGDGDKECVVEVEVEVENRNDANSAAATTSVFVIGDLHGDAICAVSWVNRTGLIANLIRDEEIPTSQSSKAATTTASSSVMPPPLYKRLNDPSKWTWTNEKATLVFMGDYVDKGPTARQTVEFVRDLTLTFPNYVTAILGNHELELLRDRDARISPAERYSAYSYATVHPGDYHNYIHDKHNNNNQNEQKDDDDATSRDATSTTTPAPRDLDEKDELVLDLLYAASMEVYSHNAHSVVRNVPSLLLPPTTDNTDAHHQQQSALDTYYRQRGIQYAITDIIPPEHRELAIERLTEYQNAYLNTYRSGSQLGSWMESRPIAHLAENINTLFVHGGVSDEVGKSFLDDGMEGVKRLNAAWYEYSHESKLYDFLTDGEGGDDNSMTLGEAVYELMTYRGNHPGYAKWESHGTYDEDEATNQDEVCKTLHDMLRTMDGIDRIAVGHTPDSNIRIYCDGAFLALDSTLGRWIRGSGNEYCPGPEHFANRKEGGGVLPSRRSRNGRYTCEEIKEVCEGQIVRLDSDGSVNVLTML